MSGDSFGLPGAGWNAVAAALAIREDNAAVVESWQRWAETFSPAQDWTATWNALSIAAAIGPPEPAPVVAVEVLDEIRAQAARAPLTGYRFRTSADAEVHAGGIKIKRAGLWSIRWSDAEGITAYCLGD